MPVISTEMSMIFGQTSVNLPAVKEQNTIYSKVNSIYSNTVPLESPIKMHKDIMDL